MDLANIVVLLFVPQYYGTMGLMDRPIFLFNFFLKKSPNYLRSMPFVSSGNSLLALKSACLIPKGQEEFKSSQQPMPFHTTVHIFVIIF